MKARDLWLLRETARSHGLAPGRLKRCGRVNYKLQVELQHAQGAIWWDGVVRCRARVCPVCWVTRRVRAALEITWVSERWTEQTGLPAYLCTFTVRHNVGDHVELTKQVRACWRSLLQRRRWRSLFERVGAQWVMAEEVTHGTNGWHPHLHMLLLTTEEIPDYIELASDLYEQWADAVSLKIGAEHMPDAHHGLDLRPCSAAQYLTKLGLELSDPTAIKGNSPLQLLRDGKLDLYMQLQDSRKRARDITYSRGLRELRDSMPVAELLPETLASLSGLQWGFLSTRKGGLGALQVLEAGADSAKDEIARLLGTLATPQ